MKVLKSIYDVIISNPIVSGIASLITIGGFIIGIINWAWIKECSRQIIGFWSNISIWQTTSLILLFSNLFFMFKFWRIWKNKTEEKNGMDKNKIKFEDLDDDEKKELKQFKTKNTILLYVELPVVIGLLRKGIIQQIQNTYSSSSGLLIASCCINPNYKEFLASL